MTYRSIFAIILLLHYFLLLLQAGLFLTDETRKTIATTDEQTQTKHIYPTKPEGREWYIDMENPRSDGLFFITSNKNISKQVENQDHVSWHIDDSSIRMNVDTPPSAQPWKNVEITGYVKIVSATNISNGNSKDISSGDSVGVLDFRARSGIHNNKSPCEGTSMIGLLHADGSIGWKKEIWHTGGYTDEKGKTKVTTEPFLGRWVGWKVVIYNIRNDTAVKMESYIDNLNTNYWVKAGEIIDDGGWSAKTPDEEFYSANCGKPKGHLILDGGPLVTFRSDNVVWYFKDLSIREIIVPSQ